MDVSAVEEIVQTVSTNLLRILVSKPFQGIAPNQGILSLTDITDYLNDTFKPAQEQIPERLVAVYLNRAARYDWIRPTGGSLFTPTDSGQILGRYVKLLAEDAKPGDRLHKVLPARDYLHYHNLPDDFDNQRQFRH
ncbi:MAG: hypothetical protein R3B53_00535 [Candidatus Paceibacterota bacterium]